jgi:hypothetical protein
MFRGISGGERQSDEGQAVELGYWQEHWYEVATRLCRVDDGVSRRVDRVSRLKALGNAVVPQVVAELGRAILYVEQGGV